MNRTPFVSVVVVNFNGERLLPSLLEGLQRQTYQNFEVVLVDNASSDRSVETALSLFPGIRVLSSRRNLGFAGGNNRGMASARGEFIALLNNDAVPDAGWLEALMKAAQCSSDIGAVGSKILFAQPFVAVRLVDSDARSSTDPARGHETVEVVFVAEESGFVSCPYRKTIFHSGFGPPANIGSVVGRWMRHDASLFLPTPRTERDGRLNLLMSGASAHPSRQLEVLVGEEGLGAVGVGPGLKSYTIPISRRAIESECFDVINNAGSRLLDEGKTWGDRGIFEADAGQFDRAEDVTAICGAAVMFSRAALERVGLFDESFFMYFEDTDMSWRLCKAGYRLRYEPASVVRHYHAASSREWSPSFTRLVARNRILMLLKHAPVSVGFEAYLQELHVLFGALARARATGAGAALTRLAVQGSLVTHLPGAILKRIGLRREPRLRGLGIQAPSEMATGAHR